MDTRETSSRSSNHFVDSPVAAVALEAPAWVARSDGTRLPWLRPLPARLGAGSAAALRRK